MQTGTLEYLPTKREIAAKCQMFCTITGWRGAAKQAPRGGEFSVARGDPRFAVGQWRTQREELQAELDNVKETKPATYDAVEILAELD